MEILHVKVVHSCKGKNEGINDPPMEKYKGKGVEKMCNSAEEYEEMIMKKAGKILDDFQKEHGFGDEDMIRLLEDIIKQRQQKS